jgi:membrane associated rhomboid family serine protease
MGNQLTLVVKNLLVINLIIFGLQILLRIDFPHLFGLRYFEADEFAVWQFFTYMFVHGSVMHIFSNMIALFMFGPWIEGTMGWRRFFTYYMLCGMGAGFLNYAVIYTEMQFQKSALQELVNNPTDDGLVQYLSKYEQQYHNAYSDDINDELERVGLNPIIEQVREAFEYRTQNQLIIGASGAIFGILMAFLLLFPNIELMMIFFPFPIKAKYLITLYILFEIYATMGYAGQSNIAHLAHLGGALIGFILIKFWGIRRQF